MRRLGLSRLFCFLHVVLLASAAVPAGLAGARIICLTLALVLGRAPATISAGPLPSVATEALFRIGLVLPVWHMALLLLAPIVVISSDHENALFGMVPVTWTQRMPKRLVRRA
jgi:hypothetical protein